MRVKHGVWELGSRGILYELYDIDDHSYGGQY